MANISDAFGTVIVTSSDLETSEKLLRIFHSVQSKFDYYTDYDLDNIHQVGERKVSANFTASGRWTFSTNLLWFGKWLQENIESEEDREFLESRRWECLFEYADYECGCEVFGQGSAVVEHARNSLLSEAMYTELNWEDLEPTYWNFFDVLGWSLQEIANERYFESILDGEESIVGYCEDIYKFLDDYANHYHLDKSAAKDSIRQQSKLFGRVLDMAEAYAQ